MYIWQHKTCPSFYADSTQLSTRLEVVLALQHHGIVRAARALTDRALAQAENMGVRFYSLSAAIEKNKQGYYQILEDTQNCRAVGQENQPLDITEWLLWLLDTLAEAMEHGLLRIERVLLKATFWKTHAQTVLSQRQAKVLDMLLIKTKVRAKK
jgi:Fic family protein